jgi:hypothetical protein
MFYALTWFASATASSELWDTAFELSFLRSAHDLELELIRHHGRDFLARQTCRVSRTT